MELKGFFTKKIVLFIVFNALLIIPTSAQINISHPKSDFWNHVRFGGGLGLGFGNNYFSASLSPSAIYQFDNTFALGVGLNAAYDTQKDIHKSTVLGGSVLALANPIEFLQLSAEFEESYVNRNFDEDFVTNADSKYWYPALFLGAGYRSGNFAFGIRYDVLYNDDKSIYADPWMPFVRMYF